MSNLFPKLDQAPKSFGDDRGMVSILYETDKVVLKRSTSEKGVFRGLHRQKAPFEQHKIIRIISGRIYDFVADPDDENGPLYYSEISPNDGWVLINSHLAHGFYALEDTVFEYFCEGGYNEQAEQTFNVTELIKSEMALQDLCISDKDKMGEVLSRSSVVKIENDVR